MFTSINSRAASAYKRVSVETSLEGASAHQLVDMLFKSLLVSLASARDALKRSDLATKGREIGRAVRIIDEGLLANLNINGGGDVAANLRGVYAYCVHCLTQANLRNDDDKLIEVIGLIEPIADAWSQISSAAGTPSSVIGV